MQVLRISKKRGLHLEKASIPQIADDEVLIRVKAVGICGSDLRLVTGSFTFQENIILGHEFSGVIEKIGKKCNKWKVGDKVVADPTIGCSRCEFCKKGKKNLCKNLGKGKSGELGVNIDGACAEFVKISCSNIYKLPKDLSFEEGTFVEPLACVLNGFNRLDIRKEETACVIGLGPTGLLFVKLFQLEGVKVFGIERSKFRRHFANNLGIRKADKKHQNFFDHVADTTGSNFSLSCKVVKPGGSVVLFGMNPQKQETIKPYDISIKNLNVIGVNMDSETFQQAISLLPKINVRQIITKTMPLIEFHNAYALLGLHLDGKKNKVKEPEALKVVLTI